MRAVIGESVEAVFVDLSYSWSAPAIGVANQGIRPSGTRAAIEPSLLDDGRSSLLCYDHPT